MQSCSLPGAGRAVCKGRLFGGNRDFSALTYALFLSLSFFIFDASATTSWQTSAATREQYLLELINRARASPEVEAARYGLNVNQGLEADALIQGPRQPLVMHPSLLGAARQHSSTRISSHNFWSPFSGQSPADYATAAGYPFTGDWDCEGLYYPVKGQQVTLWQEFLDFHYGNAFYRPLWRGVLLDETFQEAGVGVLQGMNNLEAVAALTVLLAHSQGSPSPDTPFLTGVVYNDANTNGVYDINEGLSGVTVTIRNQSSGTLLSQGLSGMAGGYAVPLNVAPDTLLQVTFTGGTPSSVNITESVTWPGDRNIKVDGVVRSPGARILRVNGNLNFGLIHPSRTRERPLVLENLGDEPLEITGITLPEHFQAGWSGVLQPGEARLVPVTLAPSSFQETYGGTLTVHANHTHGQNSLQCAAKGLRVDWVETKSEALARATAEGKKILLLAGFDEETNTHNMRATVCEAVSPNVSTLLRTAYIPWYSQVDESDEAAPYLQGTQNYPMPIICIIDPAQPDTPQDQTGGFQSPQNLYNRLAAAAPDVPLILLDPSAREVAAQPGSYELLVRAIGSWTVEQSPAWVTVQPSSGFGNSALNISVQENTADTERIGTITVSGITHQLTQNGRLDPHSFFTWIGNIELNDPKTAGFWDNSDGDMLPNIAEFLLLCDPTTSDLPNVSHEFRDGVLSLTFERRRYAADAELQVWVTEDLRSWNPFPGQLEQLEENEDSLLLRASMATSATRAAMQLRFHIP